MDSFRREHNRNDKEHSAKAARAKSRQRLAATATANPRGVNKRNEVYYYQKEHPHPAPRRSGAIAQGYGIWRDQKESTCFFTYWEAGGNDSLASSIPTEKFSGV
jgi:hypothetical protein